MRLLRAKGGRIAAMPATCTIVVCALLTLTALSRMGILPKRQDGRSVREGDALPGSLAATLAAPHAFSATGELYSGRRQLLVVDTFFGPLNLSDITCPVAMNSSSMFQPFLPEKTAPEGSMVLMIVITL